MQSSGEIAELAAALVKAQGAFPDVDKAKTANVTSKRTGQSFSYTFATMPDVQHAILPALHGQGIAVMQGTVDEDAAGFTVLTTLLHQSGQWITHRVRVPMGDATAQAAGSALSYGRRVGLVAAVCAVTDEIDDDGAAASGAEITHHNRRFDEGRQRAADAEVARRKADGGSTTIRVPAQSAPTFAMPFGKSKGAPLSAMETDDLKGALEWAESKGKFTEFQVAARAELARRDPVYAGMDEPPPALDDEDAPW